MEQHGQSQRQHARQIYEQPPQAQASSSAQGQHSASSSVQRPRQSPYVLPSPGSASSGRPGGDTQTPYGLAPAGQYGAASNMPPNPIQYAPQDITSPDPARQQPQQYPQYGPNVMYSLGQPQGPQAPQQQPYEQVPPYRQRPGNTSETLATQFGVQQYYHLAGMAPGPASGNVPELVTQNLPAQYAHPDTYSDAGPSAVSAYPGGMMEQPSQTPTYPGFAQQAQYPTQQQQQQQQVLPEDQPFENYQAQMRNIFTLAHQGALRDIGTRLLDISQYLLGNVETLGLTRDDETLRTGRIRLWDEFNRAWLVSLQRQLDLSQQVIQQNQPFTENQSIMDAQTLEHLSDELVRLCDGVDKHGLVDYQMGVAEEEIMDLIIRCMSVLDGRTGEGRTDARVSTSGSSRRRGG